MEYYAVFSGITNANFGNLENIYEITSVGNNVSLHARRTGGAPTDTAQFQASIVIPELRVSTDWFEVGIGSFTTSRAAATPAGVPIKAIRLQAFNGTWQWKVLENVV